jgi:hypothetical protein
MRRPLFAGFANIVIFPNNLGCHEVLQRKLVVDGQDTSLEFDYVLLSKFCQRACYGFPAGAHELSNVCMGSAPVLRGLLHS